MIHDPSDGERFRHGRRDRGLIGRRNETLQLRGLLADALDGRSRVLVLRGEAGVGKTALLAGVAAGADAWHVASAVGSTSAHAP